MYKPNTDESKLINQIEKIYYMKPIIEQLNHFLNQSIDQQQQWRNSFNHIHTFLRDSNNEVNLLLEKRLQSGEIKDVSQARKSIVGSAFSNLIMYIFIQNKIQGSIKPSVFITSKTSQAIFQEITTIKVGNETQKPDMDIIIYTLEESAIKNCLIMSLKTSLRERAGQTYKWKLLMEIASGINTVKDKYQIEYNPKITPYVAFATVNFYNEINNPQHRGMFQFFDKSFIAKPIQSSFIDPMSTLVDFVNTNL